MTKFCQIVDFSKNFESFSKSVFLFQNTFFKSHFKVGKIKIPKKIK